MWPNDVVVVTPGVDDLPSVGEIAKPVLIQTAISESTVEGLDEGVLSGFAWLDKAQLDLLALAP